MKRLLYSLALLLVGAVRRLVYSSFGDVPIEITSESTRMENGLAIADRDVVIRYKETMIYCDYARYSSTPATMFLTGNVRDLPGGQLLSDRAIPIIWTPRS